MDTISQERRSKNMSRIRSKDTSPELAVRRLVHAAGFRYRLHRKDLPGKPDLVFASRRKVIFIHGCFWHQHKECAVAHRPRSNLAYWLPKLQRNQERDQRAERELLQAGWSVLTLWECEIEEPISMGRKILKFLNE
ncbi:MAG TPA: DNA mismatch endonuclease Vsr [Archangium sp.]|nr:DNA mismatch endonuclease Vsr [Archangium sp.]